VQLSDGQIKEISPSPPPDIPDDLVAEFDQHADIGDAVSYCCIHPLLLL